MSVTGYPELFLPKISSRYNPLIRLTRQLIWWLPCNKKTAAHCSFKKVTKKSVVRLAFSDLKNAFSVIRAKRCLNLLHSGAPELFTFIGNLQSMRFRCSSSLKPCA